MASKIAQELLINKEAVLISSTTLSRSVAFDRCAGNAAVVIVSTAGSITVTQQCSWDNLTWFDPTDTAGTALGAIRATLTVTTGVYIAFTPVLTPFIRFKVIEGGIAATTITVRLLFRTEV